MDGQSAGDNSRHEDLLFVEPTEASFKRLRRRIRAGAIIGLSLGLSLTCGLLYSIEFLGSHRTLVFLCEVLCVSVIASSAILDAVELFTSVLVRPTKLDRLDFSKGVATEARTLVVMPTILSSRRSIARAIQSLQDWESGNSDPNILFGLLADLPDAPVSRTPGDRRMIDSTLRGFQNITKRSDRFFLFDRDRVWSESEQAFIGWERKRGKLLELNAWLRDRDSNLRLLFGKRAALTNVRFVLTLDSDTTLPRGVASTLAAILAHPTNRPHLNATARRVTRGHAIIQPKPFPTPKPEPSTYFEQLEHEEGSETFEPHLLQELSGEGPYYGKAIYDVDAVFALTDGRFPEGQILSHDTLEGAVARAAIATDVRIGESNPRTYLSSVLRRHRWIRGDWQLLPWLLPRTPARQGQEAHALSAIGRWKIADNMRRSLVTPCVVVTLASCWFELDSPSLAVAVLLGICVTPVAFVLIANIVRRSVLQEQTSIACGVAKQLLRQCASWIFVGNEAAVSISAIAKASWRTFVSHRRTLEWTSSDSTAVLDSARLPFYLKTMWPSWCLGSCGLILAQMKPAGGLLTVTFLAWLTAPIIAYLLSRVRS